MMDHSQHPKIKQTTLTEQPAHPKRAGELEIAMIRAVNTDGTVLVSVPIDGSEYKQTELAVATVALSQGDTGRQVAIMRTEKPQPQVIIIGLIRTSVDRLFDIIDLAEPNKNHPAIDQSTGQSTGQTTGQDTDHVAEHVNEPMQADSVHVDGEKVLITGEKEIVLQCGDASIALRKDGKIIIRGKSLLNRASGVNRIMGGSVQVN